MPTLLLASFVHGLCALPQRYCTRKVSGLRRATLAATEELRAVAVLVDRSASDVDTFVGENLGDSLVGQRVVGVLGREDFLDHLLDSQGWFEEDFERDGFAGGELDELALSGAADGALMNVDIVSKLGSGERHEERDVASGDESGLLLDEILADSHHGSVALFEAFDQIGGAAGEMDEMSPFVLIDFCLLLQVFKALLVVAVDTEFGGRWAADADFPTEFGAG